MLTRLTGPRLRTFAGILTTSRVFAIVRAARSQTVNMPQFKKKMGSAFSASRPSNERTAQPTCGRKSRCQRTTPRKSCCRILPAVPAHAQAMQATQRAPPLPNTGRPTRAPQACQPSHCASMHTHTELCVQAHTALSTLSFARAVFSAGTSIPEWWAQHTTTGVSITLPRLTRRPGGCRTGPANEGLDIDRPPVRPGPGQPKDRIVGLHRPNLTACSN